jgi:hypothetical protein
MKILFLFSSFLLSGFIASSQYLQTKMQISPTEYNFGVFREEAGRQTFDFSVTNTGSSPLIIRNVTASCGCTTPEWTKMPIPPGGKGKVTAIYDPANRPGAFNKTLTVYSNAVPETTILTIRGEVIPRKKTTEELFTYKVGPVRFESNFLSFSDVKKTGKKTITMPLINTSGTQAKVGFEGLPAHLTFKCIPESLAPGQKGIVEVTYDGVKNQDWGTVNDVVKIKINGVVQQNGYFSLSAKLVEDFSKLTSSELMNAPVFKLASNTFDIGKMPQATVKDIEFKFTNNGKSNLSIRHIRATCGCTVIKQESLQGKSIKPGESNSIKVSFNSGSYLGKVSKTIYVYTNDPKNSEVLLTILAEVGEVVK